MSNLTIKFQKLKNEQKAINAELSEIIEQSSNPFATYKKWLTSLEARFHERESEIHDFKHHLTNYRSSPDPTFVEISASKKRKPQYDAVTVSLLISNRERSFFNLEDIKQQNDELRLLIEQQKETLNLIKTRLKLFGQYERNQSISKVVESLKQGQAPLVLGSDAPSRVLELQTKQRHLSAELKSVVEKRKILTNQRLQKKLLLRKEREKNKRTK